MKSLINKILRIFITLMNEISFCKFVLFKELTRVKVTEKYNTNQADKDELKKRFYKIEEIKQRDFLNMLTLFDSRTSFVGYLNRYVDFNLINSEFYGNSDFDLIDRLYFYKRV
jgi:hypothetical protein